MFKLASWFRFMRGAHPDLRYSSLPTAQRGFLHCPDRTRVLRHQGIDGQQGDALDSRLCHQDSVEGILMNQRQALGGDDRIADDWQFAVPVVQ